MILNYVVKNIQLSQDGTSVTLTLQSLATPESGALRITVPAGSATANAATIGRALTVTIAFA